MSDSDDWAAYESGPFCPHWTEIGYGLCEEVCGRCNHICSDHDAAKDTPCREHGCTCPAFVDKP